MLYQREFQNNEEPAKHHISCFGYETEADRQYPTHCHAYCEISYLVSGERYQIINGQRYKVEPGSFFLFSPLCMHGYHNITECQDLVIQFSSDFLYQVSSSLQKDQVLEISPDAEPFLMLDGEHRKSLDDLYQKRFYNRIYNKKGNLAEEWQMNAVILQFLAKLLENGSIQLHQSYGGKEEIQQISDVIHYLMANPAERLDIGFVFQNYALFRYKTVYDNIAFGLKIQKKSKAEIKNRVEELIELVGLKGLEKRYPKQLSGGQRQRVAFARALATQPHLLLLDEPFAAIDAKVRKELRSWLRELINRVGITSIFVTHDQDEAIEVADQIIVTNKGRIEQIGTPVEVYSNPQTPFMAQFLGEPVIINDYASFNGFHDVSDGKTAVIRPEFITVRKKNEFNPYPVTKEEGVVERVSFRGNGLELRIRVHDEILIANRQIGQEMVSEGEHVNVFLHKIYLVDDNAGKVEVIVNHAVRNNESVVI